jgi:hypothetical protein
MTAKPHRNMDLPGRVTPHSSGAPNHGVHVLYFIERVYAFVSPVHQCVGRHPGILHGRFVHTQLPRHNITLQSDVKMQYVETVHHIISRIHIGPDGSAILYHQNHLRGLVDGGGEGALVVVVLRRPSRRGIGGSRREGCGTAERFRSRCRFRPSPMKNGCLSWMSS